MPDIAYRLIVFVSKFQVKFHQTLFHSSLFEFPFLIFDQRQAKKLNLPANLPIFFLTSRRTANSREQLPICPKLI